MKNKQVDAYIARSAPFARPILTRVRAAFHKGCPALEEKVKWGVPSFEYKGLMGGAAAFKAHVAWGFWRQKEMPDPDNVFKNGGGMMGGGKITDVSQLPPEKTIVKYVRAAMKLNESGPMKRGTAAPKRPVNVPRDLAAALKTNARARAAFEGFPPSHKREYVEWIVEAKKPETRERRLATTIDWLAQGKSKNWKYEKC